MKSLNLTLVFCALITAGCHLSYTTEKGWHDPTKDDAGNPVQPTATQAPSLSTRVAVFQVNIDKNLQKVFNQAEVQSAWRQKFDDAPGYSTVSQKKVDKAARDEAKGKYIYFQIGNATRVHLRVWTKTSFKNVQGKIGRVTQLMLTAQVGTRENLETITVEGRGVGFDGKVFPDSTFQQKLVTKELEQMAEKIRSRIQG